MHKPIALRQLMDDRRIREQVREQERITSGAVNNDVYESPFGMGIGFGLGFGAGIGSSVEKGSKCSISYTLNKYELDTLSQYRNDFESLYVDITQDIDPLLLDVDHLSAVLTRFRSHEKWKSIYEQAYIAESWKQLMIPLQILSNCKHLIERSNCSNIKDSCYWKGLDDSVSIEVCSSL